MSLQRVACTCHAWGHLLRRGQGTPAAAIWGAAWLTVPMFGEDEHGRPCVTLTAADALRRAPPGERVRLRAGTTITEEVNVLQPVELLAEENVTMKGKLVLQGGSFAPGVRHGVVRGLKLRHFMEEAVNVIGGHWTLEDCDIDSTKRTRASSAVIVRNNATLDLRRCAVRDCAHAVVLERAASKVVAERCSFTNVKEGFYTRGGGTVRCDPARTSSPTPVHLRLGPHSHLHRPTLASRWSSSTTPSSATKSRSSSTTGCVTSCSTSSLRASPRATPRATPRALHGALQFALHFALHRRQVTGHAMGNSLDGSMFGRYFRPRGFRCSANECAATMPKFGPGPADRFPPS